MLELRGQFQREPQFLERNAHLVERSGGVNRAGGFDRLSHTPALRAARASTAQTVACLCRRSAAPPLASVPSA